MKYTTFLFDLDGVLVNTDEIQYQTTRCSVLEILNYDISNNFKVDKIFRSTITTLEKLYFLSSYISLNEDTIQNIYQRKKILANIYFAKLEKDLEKINIMKYLKDNKCKIAVVTNSNKESTTIILKNIGIYDFIDVIIANDDVVNKKPFPDPYLKAIEILGSKKEDCIIFEDSEVGLMSAKNAECYFYHVETFSYLTTDLIKSINK